jgi:translation initiation factor 5B
MAPKKKGGKKAADDWEADLGETIAPTNGDTATTDPAADAPEEQAEDGDAPVGGLMAMMKKNREKRKKKGLSENFVDGESSHAAAPEPTDITSFQAPQEASVEDEFTLPEKKGKGGKQNKKEPAAKAPAAKADGDDVDASGKVLTKAEKEKLKKEREKQRKKEQVSNTTHIRDDLKS